MPNSRQHLKVLIEEKNNTKMLPTTDNNNNKSSTSTRRLNAAFVADNSLGKAQLMLEEYQQNISASGNIEAETNKTELDDNEDELEKYKSADESENIGDNKSSSSSSSSSIIMQRKRLTMENNEETEANKNLNESLVEETALQKSKKSVEGQVSSPLELSTAAVEVDDDLDEIVKQQDENNERIEIALAEQQPEPEEVDVNGERDAEAEDEDRIVKSSTTHLNYGINRDRENIESSDDDEDIDNDDKIVMHATFNSEWADLINTDDVKNNELGNDIDLYAAMVPIDLSNDIAVNDIAAAANPQFFNPDAEIIDVLHDGTMTNDTMSAAYETFSMEHLNLK